MDILLAIDAVSPDYHLQALMTLPLQVRYCLFVGQRVSAYVRSWPPYMEVDTLYPPHGESVGSRQLGTKTLVSTQRGCVRGIAKMACVSLWGRLCPLFADYDDLELCQKF